MPRAEQGWFPRGASCTFSSRRTYSPCLPLLAKGGGPALPLSTLVAPPCLAWTQRRDAPGWVRAVAAGGFRSPAGALAMAGLFGLPLWLYARACLPAGGPLTADAWTLLLLPGRVLAAAVEAWLVGRRLGQLLEEDTAARLRRHSDGGRQVAALTPD